MITTWLQERRSAKGLLQVGCVRARVLQNDMNYTKTNLKFDRGRKYRLNAVRSVHTTEVKILPYRTT